MSTANTGIPIHIAVVASALIKTFAVVTAVLDSGSIFVYAERYGLLAFCYSMFYPSSQKATGVNPWMNARWVPSVALAKGVRFGGFRPMKPVERCRRRKAVGLHAD